MRVLIFIFLFAVTAFSQIPAIEPGVSEELAKWRASQYSNISYKLNLTLEKMSPVLRGSMEIHITQAAYACAEPNCPPMAIILDWRKIPGHEKDSTISNVTLNGSELRLQPRESITPKGVTLNYEESNDHLIFRDGVKMGENVIKLDFTSPILTSGSAITRYVDKEDDAEYIYSLFVPSDASTAFPVLDQPDLKARFTLRITYPDGWNVVSNTNGNRHMLIEEPISDTEVKFTGQHDTEFEETQPISTYVVAFAVGDFDEFVEGQQDSVKTISSDGKLTAEKRKELVWAKTKPRVYVRKSQAAKFKPHAAEVFRLQLEAVKYLETYFDYKFPFPKYDLVLIPEFPFGGMEHAGATFLREQSVIFPQEPTKNDIISRALLIFHETAHQWFGDCVTMKWFDDLWLKEGFAEFMAYKTLEHVMPEYNAWKVFFERNKQAAYATDSTKGTTPIYQPIANLNSAKSAYGNIVYRKAPSFLRQAEFYLGEDKFQSAARAFLKKHEFANAGWEDLVKEFAAANLADAGQSGSDAAEDRTVWARWGYSWVNGRGLSIVHTSIESVTEGCSESDSPSAYLLKPSGSLMESGERLYPWMSVKVLAVFDDRTQVETVNEISPYLSWFRESYSKKPCIKYIFPNYQDYAYGIFLLDDRSRDYVLENIGREKDDFLRTMMWGSLWDSVREAELAPKDYVELVIKNIGLEKDEGTIQTLLSRVTTAMNYYVAVPPTLAGGKDRASYAPLKKTNQGASTAAPLPPAYAGGSDMLHRLEDLLIDKIQNASTQGQRITYYRAFLNIASTDRARDILKQILNAGSGTAKSPNQMTLKTKDQFDIVTRLAVLGDTDAPKLLANLEKTETSDDAKRYAYAAHAAFGTAENKAKFFNDFLSNKDISESWIESAIVPFNSIRHADLTQQYLTRALAELPNLKRTRKIFFVGNWLAAFIGGQRDERALAIINKFLADNPNLDTDLRLKILENSDLIERAVKIRTKYKN